MSFICPYSQFRFSMLFRKELLLFFVLLYGFPSASLADLTTPLSVSNQAPLIQIYGLPGMSRSLLLPAGVIEAQLSMDVSNHFLHENTGGESLLLDGESYLYSLQLSYGVSDRLELSLDIPYVAHQGGQLDGFIDDWHRFFGLPTNGRENGTKDQLSFIYDDNGTERLSQQDETKGLGDIRFSGAWQLSEGTDLEPTTIAFHSSLKLPTGDSEKLTGSGGADLAVCLSGGRQFPVAWGDLGLITSLGLLFVGEGEVLEEQQRSLVWFGGLGIALQPWQRVRLQVQVDFHSSFYHDSRMDGVDSSSVQLATGGTIILDEGYEIELAVVEDIAVGTAPDVVFHFALRRRF